VLFFNPNYCLGTGYSTYVSKHIPGIYCSIASLSQQVTIFKYKCTDSLQLARLNKCGQSSVVHSYVDSELAHHVTVQWLSAPHKDMKANSRTKLLHDHPHPSNLTTHHT
jgi:hypothetical protein